MEKEYLKRIITDQRAAIGFKLKKKNIIKREVQSTLLLDNIERIIVITGIRRAGKSTLAHLLLQNYDYAYINFDDERLAMFSTLDFDILLQAFIELYNNPKWLIFDEIQNIEKWELFASRIKESFNVIITGSNSKLLSRELSTHLTGRHYDIMLYPFSFKEFLTFKNINDYNPYLTKDIVMLRKMLSTYVQRGGFPEADQQDFTYTTFYDIINKDILYRRNIRYSKTFKEFAMLVVTNFSKKISFISMKKQLGLKSENTLKNYLEFLEESFIVFSIPKFSFKQKEHIKNKRKVYVSDTGIINSIAFQFSKNIGKIYENIVAIELQRRKSAETEIFYFETLDSYEVDFLVKKGTKITQLIQVTAINSITEFNKRELRALLHAKKQLGCDNLLVITDNLETEQLFSWFSITAKISFVPLWKWLLYPAVSL